MCPLQLPGSKTMINSNVVSRMGGEGLMCPLQLPGSKTIINSNMVSGMGGEGDHRGVTAFDRPCETLWVRCEFEVVCHQFS